MTLITGPSDLATVLISMLAMKSKLGWLPFAMIRVLN
jgi:hypothetical protein